MMVMLLSAAIVAAQVPTFTTAVDMVGVTVTAVDARSDTPIGDLEVRDFSVAEDGAVQRIAFFEKNRIPASVLVMMDASGSVSRRLPHIRVAVARLIRSLREGDEVQVAQFAARFQELSEFTTDHEYAASVLTNGFVRDDDTALHRAMIIGVRSLERRYPGEACRRRVLVVLSDGENTTGSFSEEATLAQIRRSGVLCYVVYLEPPMVFDNRQKAARDFMKRIAHESGGRLITVPYQFPEQMGTAYSTIADELGVQYHLGFASPGRPGWHEIDVVLKQRFGITLRFRRSYYMPTRR